MIGKRSKQGSVSKGQLAGVRRPKTGVLQSATNCRVVKSNI